MQSDAGSAIADQNQPLQFIQYTVIEISVDCTELMYFNQEFFKLLSQNFNLILLSLF